MSKVSAGEPSGGSAAGDGPDPTRLRIIAVARTNLRRFGVSKVTVVDIARDLGMSHSNVYRYFRSKAEILNAVVEDWLQEERALLERLSAGSENAAELLERLGVTLVERKRRKRIQETELSGLYDYILSERPAALASYDAANYAAFARIISAGITTGEFRNVDLPVTVRAIRNALHVFFDPGFTPPPAETAEDSVRAVLRLLTAGLSQQPDARAGGVVATRLSDAG